MHTHTGFSDPLSLQSIIKPRIVRYVGRAPYFVSATSGVLGRREGMRKEMLSVPSNKVFMLPTYFSV